MSFSEIETE